MLDCALHADAHARRRAIIEADPLPPLRRAETQNRDRQTKEGRTARVDPMTTTLTLKQAAAVLHRHPSTRQDKARRGISPGRKRGRRWVCIEADLLDWIRAGEKSIS